MRRISWNILLPEGNERFDPYIAGAGGIAADDYGDCFSLIKGTCGIVGSCLVS
jgi:hypothetical protein